MSWTKLAARSASRVERVTVRVTSAGYDKPHLVIRIARSIAAESGLPTDHKSRVDIYAGDGAHAGRLRIASARHGDYSCCPQGKVGALKIALSAPAGAPAEYPSDAVETAIDEDGGLTFVLPWHVPAGEREVEEVFPQDDLPTAMDVRGILKSDDGAYRTWKMPRKTVPEFIAETATATLDAVEESARPVKPESPLTAEQESWLEKLDQPVNGTTRTHVYADSEAETKLKFTHAGKSCLLNKRQHVVVSKLYAVMLKKIPGGFLDYDNLIKACGVRDKYILQATVAGARKVITPLGLAIKSIEKTGYWMEAM